MAGKTTKIRFSTNIVERYKKGESSRKIGKDEGCSYNTVLRGLKRKGINTSKFWTEKEMEKLSKFYPNTSNENLLRAFPNRSMEAIRATANNLGLYKKEYEEICKDCGRKFIIKNRHGRNLCSKCIKKQWEHNNLINGSKRKNQWLQRNPEYLKQYYKRPDVRKRVYEYMKQLRRESPKFRLDCNMGSTIYLALKDKKAGRKWETLVGYTLDDLMKHLESQFEFDENMNWENYGSYWHIDHIKPRSLFKYTSADDAEFKKCWALENLQPLERITNLRKNNTFCNTSQL